MFKAALRLTARPESASRPAAKAPAEAGGCQEIRAPEPGRAWARRAPAREAGPPAAGDARGRSHVRPGAIDDDSYFAASGPCRDICWVEETRPVRVSLDPPAQIVRTRGQAGHVQTQACLDPRRIRRR